MDEKLTVKGLAEGLALLIEAIKEQNQGQQQRLIIMDSQLRVLNEFADRLEHLEGRFEEVLTNFQSVCQVCARLNILCSNVGTQEKGPQNESEEIDISEKLTSWN